jgi:CheY-like chemotaxis protein
MLIDDNIDDNFIHERIINKSNTVQKIIAKTSAKDALEYLSLETTDDNYYPELIFLDINMPGMKGWQFVTEFNKQKNHLKQPVIIVMLTTSENPDDLKKAVAMDGISDFRTKPLTKQMLEEIFDKHF